MRIATKTMYDSSIRNLGSTSEAMTEANQIVASGKRINCLSDDPVGLVTVLNLNSSLEYIEQMERNINTGRTWLEAGESALTQIQDILSEAKSLTVEMSSDTCDASERTDAAALVEGYLEEILSLANSQATGRYIFGGTETGAVPFAFDDEDNPAGVLYSGNDSPFTVRIGRDTDVAVGRAGEEIFGTGGSGIFQTLIDLKTALEGNDREGIQEAMGLLDRDFETVSNLISDTGAKIVRLDTKEAILQDLELNYTERKSQLEDADIAEAVLKLESAELAYQAALSSSSKIMSLSLVDYI